MCACECESACDVCVYWSQMKRLPEVRKGKNVIIWIGILSGEIEIDYKSENWEQKMAICMISKLKLTSKTHTHYISNLSF